MCACAERERVSSDVDLLSLIDGKTRTMPSIITITTTAIAARCAWILISAAALHRWLDGVDARVRRSHRHHRRSNHRRMSV